MAPTQVRHPWRATLRTIFQGALGLCGAWALIVEAAGWDTSWQWVSASLAFTAGVTRVMAIPAVDTWLARFLPWLAADPPAAKPSYGEPGTLGPLTED